MTLSTRRAEPFRYSLTPPIPCWIQITQINGTQITSKLAEAKLINISKSGCRIESELDLHVTDNSIYAAIHIQLTEDLCVYPGHIRWQRMFETSESHYHYGLALETNVQDKEKITVELRALAGSKRVVVM